MNGMNYNKNDIVICIKGGTNATGWKKNEMHKIMDLKTCTTTNDFFVGYDKRSDGGIWFNSVRLATSEEINLFNQGIIRISEIITDYSIF